MGTSLSSYHSVVGGAASAEPAERPESAYTSRIRLLSQHADVIAARLERVLSNLRSPPPSTADTDKPRRIASVEDHLQHTENANERINNILIEIEALIG